VVAYGMIGASLSGVTFMSVPGDVLANSTRPEMPFEKMAEHSIFRRLVALHPNVLTVYTNRGTAERERSTAASPVIAGDRINLGN
jgi:tRNA G37 N-methylase Trm5